MKIVTMYQLAVIVGAGAFLTALGNVSAFTTSHGGVWGGGGHLVSNRIPRGGSASAGTSSAASRKNLLCSHNVQQDSEATATATLENETDKKEVTIGDRGTVLLASHEEFICPNPDNRSYRSIRLANNLEVLLVSSPENDVEAGAVHVQAGHMDDPPHRPGLAHFHEHMLFLGTEKYPSENEYEAFLSSHGGSSNAYTDMEDTNYYFSVTPHADDDDDQHDENDADAEKTSTALSGALDRLAQFFIAPRFDASMVEREMRAIDSEYRNALTSDSWRNFQLLKGSANASHPFGKFGCGNYETLTNSGGINGGEANSLPHHDLLEFWKSYYKTYNMRLVVVGRANLDALQSTVEETFGLIPKSTGTPRKKNLLEANVFPMEHAQYDGVPAFGAEQLNKIREVVPLIESRTIKLYFAAPPLHDPVIKKSRPQRVISHLLGHESPGSLHDLLNEEGLITGLSSGVSIDSWDFSLFSLTLSLTPKGMAQKDYVLDLLFQWISLIKRLTPDTMKAYHEELRQISRTNFMFRENGDPTDFCSAAADLLFKYKASEVLVGASKTGDFDAKVAEAFLHRLEPENALITIINADLKKENDDGSEVWQTEKWYKAKYREVEIPETLAKKWKTQQVDSRLRLPALNAYIPSDFSLRCEDEKEVRQQKLKNVQNGEKEPPQLLEERPDLRLWHKLDRKWKVPKTAIRLSLESPNVYRSPRSITLNRIYQRVLNDDLNSFVYDANVAGCNYDITCTPSGYRVSVTGYSEKLSFLLDTLTSRMLSLIQEMKEGIKAHPGLASKFSKALENLLRETKNYRLDSPYEVASYNSRLLLEERVWNLENYIAEMEGEYAERDPLTMEECASVVEECLLGRVRADVLCLGNVNEQGAREVAEVVDSHFLRPSRPLLEIETPYFRSLMLPTRAEAVKIFGPSVAGLSIPVIQQDVALSESEENNAAELIVQVGCDLDLGYEGVAMLDLIAHIAYNSAFNQLRTKEQLGYLVSAFARKTVGGSWGLSVVVQSSVALPARLEERIEAWLKIFRDELEEMSPESIAMEAGAVVAQFLERDTKLSQEVSHLWGAILMTESMSGAMRTPAFDRLERLAAELTVEQDRAAEEKPLVTAEELKQKLLDFFDKHLAADSEHRRAMSARVYSQKGRKEFDSNVGKPGVLSSFDDIGNVKQFFSSWPIAPYWRTEPSR